MRKKTGNILMNWPYHFDPDDVVKLYQQKQWRELTQLYSPAAVARSLGYLKALNCANELDDGYAETLHFVLRGMYSEGMSLW